MSAPSMWQGALGAMVMLARRAWRSLGLQAPEVTLSISPLPRLELRFLARVALGEGTQEPAFML